MNIEHRFLHAIFGSPGAHRFSPPEAGAQWAAGWSRSELLRGALVDAPEFLRHHSNFEVARGLSYLFSPFQSRWLSNAVRECVNAATLAALLKPVANLYPSLVARRCRNATFDVSESSADTLESVAFHLWSASQLPSHGDARDAVVVDALAVLLRTPHRLCIQTALVELGNWSVSCPAQVDALLRALEAGPYGRNPILAEEARRLRRDCR